MPKTAFIKRRRRPMRGPLSRRQRRLLTIGLVVIVVALASYGRSGCAPKPAAVPLGDRQRYHQKTFTVIKVVDGDTLDIEIPDGDKPYTRVRLWGVDTPETKHPRLGPMYFGAEASAFTEGLALGQPVMVELEPTERSRDKYGRLLAYLYLPGGKMLNEELLSNGYAYADERFAHHLRERFGELQHQAQGHNKGLWENIQPDQFPPWYQKRHRQTGPAANLMSPRKQSD